jgi:UDPglucose 6-dehydrogenase
MGVYLCEYYGLPEVAEYWEQVVKINDFQARRFVKNIINRMFNTLGGKKIAIFGFAFKSDTGDTRESPAITICKMLLEENATLAIHDPKALCNAKLDLSAETGKITYCEDPVEAVTDAHAIVILTDWEQFKTYEYEQFYAIMKKPAFIFDGRNILNHQAMYDLGYNVFPLGQKAKYHLDKASY